MSNQKLKKVIVHRQHPGHPWIFSNEIIKAEEGIDPGDVVKVEEGKKTIGSGFYNPHSLIAIRLFSTTEQNFNEKFLSERLKNAFISRTGMGSSFRLVHSESDGLPGLVIDKYNDLYVIQINSLGMEKNKDLLFRVLIDEYKPAGIYEKSEETLRKIEGLEIINRVVYGKIPELVEIEQDGFKFLVDIINGQKTGFFFDQRENRKKISRFAWGEILDCFCYTGGFSIYSAKKGNTNGIDISEPAVELAKRNALLNNLKCNFLVEDVFVALRKFYNEKRSFDTIILDPPSFTKSKKKKYQALRGYKEINLMAMKLLNKVGILFTSSCSYHISHNEFITMLREAAADAKREFLVIDTGRQANDHPVLLNFPEGNYLKSVILKAV
uniref:Class I SAM-dependent rRNA methyltransferase n=1 Tax=candidate division WOR-3 bacterium TaxID=2052148 RepID=A0A7C4XLF6_UNCW3